MSQFWYDNNYSKTRKQPLPFLIIHNFLGSRTKTIFTKWLTKNGRLTKFALLQSNLSVQVQTDCDMHCNNLSLGRATLQMDCIFCSAQRTETMLVLKIIAVYVKLDAKSLLHIV